jgi:hypothetical protein
VERNRVDMADDMNETMLFKLLKIIKHEVNVTTVSLIRFPQLVDISV